MHRMKDHAAAVISDAEFATVAERWPENTPDTKEAYLIRQIFDGKVSSVFWSFIINDSAGLFPTKTASDTAVRQVC